MTLLLGAFTIGLILSLLALGVFISFRIFSFPDITADGSVTLGASVAAVLLVNGGNPLLATGAGKAEEVDQIAQHFVFLATDLALAEVLRDRCQARRRSFRPCQLGVDINRLTTAAGHV